MASQPPAGHNPEVSLLQGGTAVIQPVQGGGGMEAGAVPSGYNPEHSLLNTGHNAPIVAVKGGSQEGGKGGEVYKDYVLERYEPSFEDEGPKKELKSGLIDAQRRVALTYVDNMAQRLKQLRNFSEELYTIRNYDDIQIPTYNICNRTISASFFKAVRKRYVIIDIDDPVIYVISNLNGNLIDFDNYMNFIFKQTKETSKKLPANTYIIFTGSFFSTDIAKNEALYYYFLKYKEANIDNLFYINELSESFIQTSCLLTKKFYGSTDKTHLIPFYEPDILIFKKQHILFQNSRPTGERKYATVSLSEVLKKIDKKPELLATYKSFVLSPSSTFDIFIPNESTKGDQVKYVTFNYNENADTMVFPEKTDILCPKNQTCNGFKVGHKLNTLDDNSKLPPGFYVISKNTDKMPLLKEEGSTLTQAELEYLEGKEPVKEEEEPVKKVRFANEEEKKEEEVVAEEEEEEEEPLVALEGAFKEDSAAVKATELEIELNAKVYMIRIPFLEGVIDDWLLGVFTKDEARLLNALQFSPALLSKVFGPDQWLSRLTDFMTSLMNSSCFHDFTLLTSAECSNAQEFVKQVYFGLFTQTLNEMYDEFGVPKPQKLGQLVSLMKNVGAKQFDKYSFTGDLLNRFHVIKYDPKTSQYYTDFAKIDEATWKLLEGLTFRRIASTNYDEIKEAIVEKAGGKTKSGGGGEVFDLGDPIQEGGGDEVFDLGDPVSTRKNKTRKHRSK